MNRLLAPLVILAVLAAGCGDPDSSLSGAIADGDTTNRTARRSIPTGEPSIRGVVTYAESGSLRVEANPAEESGSPKAVVRLMADTDVVYRSGGPARADDLTIGLKVSVWFVGPVAESYPVQASASLVVIEPMDLPGTP